MNSTDQLQERYVNVGSIDTRYWQAGDSGNVFILLHGGGGYRENDIIRIISARKATRKEREYYES